MKRSSNSHSTDMDMEKLTACTIQVKKGTCRKLTLILKWVPGKQIHLKQLRIKLNDEQNYYWSHPELCTLSISRWVSYVWTYTQVRTIHIEQAFILVHPHLHHTGCVYPVCILASRECIRVEAAKDVPNTGAGDGFQGATTLPHLKQQLPLYSNVLEARLQKSE